MRNNYEWWLTACIYFEARGETLEGQTAVAHVILNRCLRREQSIIQVVQADKQFSWYNGGVEPPIKDWSSFVSCMVAVDRAISERYQGKSLRGADHYHANYMPTYPYWSDEYPVVARIGKHIFYRS